MERSAFLDSSGRVTSVLWAQGAVVGAVAALLVEVDVGSDAALQQRLGRPGVVAHAQEDLVRLVLAEEAQGVHLQDKPTAQPASDQATEGSSLTCRKCATQCEPHRIKYYYNDN